ncbi:YcxB family protein [Actinoplanes teichomyceticus]|uniref:YcxB-like C-terminal domain-containing protein n=1 Tax=Actinoplanes teichomyceticus TaxID=1867 RepID=A0A561WSC2_ACTTI|nr:YcxB family protein [Actinoplanes teichomyceticus]TWG26770.1 hypothetical protein FHX34_1011768 [Actinoplanes teichomyceticus]GIF15168.1 hypothetical protein Ate01nite_52000 [Actinoplanes teichomyceticus]
MEVHGEFRYTYAWLRRTITVTLYRRHPRRQRVLSLIVTVLGALLFARRQEAVFALMTGLGLFVGLAPEWMALIGWLQQRHMLTTPVRYTVTWTGVETRMPSSSSRVEWSGLSWVRTLPDMWLLRHGAVTIAIPRAAFRPEDQAAIDGVVAGVKAG